MGRLVSTINTLGAAVSGATTPSAEEGPHNISSTTGRGQEGQQPFIGRVRGSMQNYLQPPRISEGRMEVLSLFKK